MAKETSKDIGSINDIPDLMLDVTFAGSDTTSSSMAWFILYMVLYPDIQEKIHDELDRVIAEGDLPRWQAKMSRTCPTCKPRYVKLCV